jgi:hypothetical protein
MDHIPRAGAAILRRAASHRRSGGLRRAADRYCSDRAA